MKNIKDFTDFCYLPKSQLEVLSFNPSFTNLFGAHTFYQAGGGGGGTYLPKISKTVVPSTWNVLMFYSVWAIFKTLRYGGHYGPPLVTSPFLEVEGQNLALIFKFWASMTLL